MNWTAIILIGTGLIALVIFLVMRNQKDKKTFEDQLNNDYRKSKDEEGDTDTEEPLK
jgi:hypothetical protein